jgi:pectate lyase
MSSYSHEPDVEKTAGGSAAAAVVVSARRALSSGSSGGEKKRSSVTVVDDADAKEGGGAVVPLPGESFEIGSSSSSSAGGWYAKVQRVAGKLNVEQRGIERVPEDERTDDGFRALLNVATMVCFFFFLGYLTTTTLGWWTVS